MIYLRKIVDGGLAALPAETIIAAISPAGVARAKKDIVSATGLDANLVSVTLSALLEHRVVRRVSHGVWTLRPARDWVGHPDSRKK